MMTGMATTAARFEPYKIRNVGPRFVWITRHSYKGLIGRRAGSRLRENCGSGIWSAIRSKPASPGDVYMFDANR
jgi:hypothetical protein